MDIQLSLEQADQVFQALQNEYKIYAPKVFVGEGRHSYTDSVRYAQISSFGEVEYKRKSNYSAKEVLLPINHTVAITVGDTVVPMPEEEKGILIFLRACDRHAIERMDRTFGSDEYYMKRRNRTKFVLMECEQAWDTCFCLSTETNQTEQYDLGVRFGEEHISIKIKDQALASYFEGYGESVTFEMKYATTNETVVRIPHIEEWDRQTLNKIKALPLWESYSTRCIGCGSCNMACGTCTCLQKKEVAHAGEAGLKEHKRIWSGCQLIRPASLKKQTVKAIVPTRIRQRVMDKFYRPKLEVSKEQGCVGCGRCIDICPKYINFATTVNKFCDELDKIYEESGMTFDN